MRAGTIYPVLGNAVLCDQSSPRFLLAVEDADVDGNLETLIFQPGKPPQTDAVSVTPKDLPAGSVLLDRLYPLHGSALADAAGTLALGDMEQVMRALVRRAVKRHYRYGHPSQDFVPGESSVPVSGRVYDDREIVSLMEASLDFWLTTGRFNAAFEKRFGTWLGLEHVLTTNSGSSANLLAITALTSPKLGERALRPGDEVITVAAGFPTTVNPILQNGMVPVFCDVSPATYNIVPKTLEQARSSKTRAVILAHTLGNPFDLGAVTAFCREHDLWLVEDCCDALGAMYPNADGVLSPVGTFGDIATFSFYPAHHITMGEGGALATSSSRLAKIIESFRDWGRDCWCPPGHDNTCGCRYAWQLGDLPAGYDHKYVYSHMGYNLKITDMQAAVALAQLDKLDGFIRTRRGHFDLLTEGLQDMCDVFILPMPTPGSQPSWFGYPLTIREASGINREALLRYLESARIGSRLLFGGNLAKQPYMRDRPHRLVGELSGTNCVMRQTFWIGVFPGLTQSMLEYTIETIHRFVRTSC